MTDALQLTPFLEPEENDLSDSDRFVAGFKDVEGHRCGVLVPLDRDVIHSRVLSEIPFEVQMDSEGRVQAGPDILMVSDEIFDEMYKRDLLPKVSVDDLVADVISIDQNEPNDGEDGVMESYMLMRERLLHAVTLIDAEIARRKADDDNG